MGNSDKSTVMHQVQNQIPTVQNQQNTLNNQFTKQYNDANTIDSNLSKTIASGYSNFNPGVTQSQLNDLWYGGGASGGIDPSQISSAFNESTPGFQNFATNGGLTPAFTSSFNNNMNTMDQASNQFGQIGAAPVSSADQNNILANGSFQNFIDTGGFSPTDISNIRAQAIAPTRGVYADANRQLNQQAAISNGFAPNIAASLAQMSRDESNQISQSDIAANAGIAQMVQAGKEYGATGMSNAGQALANLNLEGRIAGATGQSQTALAEAQAKTAVQQLDDQMKMEGLQGLSDQEKAQLSAELQNAQINEQASATNASLQAQKAMLQFNTEANLIPQLRLQGLQGATNLLGTTPGATQAAAQDLLNNFNIGNTSLNNLYNTEVGATKIPSGFSNVMGGISSGLSGVGSLLSGIGALG